MDKPSYLQIKDSLLDQIESGRYKAGDRLPSERELSRLLGVSRMTVRHAISHLVNHGIVERHPGKGTFIAEPKIDHHVDILKSYGVSIEDRGRTSSTKLLKVEHIPANKKLAEKLQVEIGKPLYHIHRIRYNNDEPLGLEYSYFPESACPDLEQFNLERRSIFMILEKEYGISLKIAEQIFEPIIANEYESKMLSVKIGAPLMLIVRISYDEDGKAIEYAKDIYRGDRIRFISRSPKRIMDEQPSNSPII